METYTVPHFGATVHVALFEDVANAEDLLGKIRRAATLEGEEGDKERANVNYAFVDAKLVSCVTTGRLGIPILMLVSDNKSPSSPNIHIPRSPRCSPVFSPH